VRKSYFGPIKKFLKDLSKKVDGRLANQNAEGRNDHF
jgi:hypothetical protein